MRRRPEDLFEEFLRQATQREERHNDDVVIHYVVLPDGREVKIVERRSELQFVEDPENKEATIPITVSHIKYRLDDQGRPFQKMRDVGACQLGGCIVRSNTLFICRWCRQSICQKHVIFVGKRAYCRKIRSICWVIGRSYQIFWLAYRTIRYCFRTLTGLNAESDASTYSDSEESLLNSFSYSSYEDLSEDEKR